MCKSGHEEWASLFTTEVESLWNTEPPDTRMVVIINHILQKEFKRIETNINEKIQTYKHEMKLASNLEDVESKDELSSTNINIENFESLEQSPTLNRFRKIKRRKKNSCLLRNSDCNCSFSLLNSLRPQCVEPTHGVCVVKSNTIMKDVCDDPDVTEVIDLSILPDSADVSCNNKKFKLSKSKKTNDLINKSNQNNLTLTQLIDNKAWSSNASKVDRTDNKTIKGDESKINPLSRPTLKSNLFQNYDRLPVKKSVVPEHPHVTETVRRKADRLKLPGWTCKECQDYYKNLNLTKEQLREKINICSKHRNKYQPLDETPKGYWDVTMVSSEED